MPEPDRSTWNDFAAASAGGSFLQAWEWGEFQEAFGVKVWRLTAAASGRLTGTALVLERRLPSGHAWLYVPRGPLGNDMQPQLAALARAQRALFVRAEPGHAPAEPWQKADRDIQPRHTIMVNLAASEESLLENMRAKTRYNIRLAEKKGATVRFSSAPEDVEAFLRLSRDVAGRGGFRFHPDDYYRVMLRVLGEGDQAELALAEHAGEVLAAHILVYFGTTATYVHGASSSGKRNLMAPHLLQWESMRRARERGCTQYDFFGVCSPDAEADHPWRGITRFKEGFGGRRVSYPGAYDLVLNKLGYFVYTAVRRLS